jgi:hypothetical protein
MRIAYKQATTNNVNKCKKKIGSRMTAVYEASAKTKELNTVVETTPIYSRFHKLGEYACLATHKNQFGNNAKFGTNTIIAKDVLEKIIILLLSSYYYYQIIIIIIKDCSYPPI